MSTMLEQTVRLQPYDVDARLRSLGLTTSTFQAAAARGHLAMANCTGNDPPFIPGTTGWAMAVRTLREELLPLNWRKEDPGNYSLTISDAHAVAIVVASGDEGTGLPHLQPRTKSAKGIHTALAVESNQRDLFLDQRDERDRDAAVARGYQTWMFLVRIEPDGVRSELSLPAFIDAQGNITIWRERIILPKFDADPNLAIPVPEDFGPDIVVPVSKKA